MAATILRAANDRLSAFFRDAWSQSDLRVTLDRDGLRIDLLIEEVGGSTYVLGERSDGLRAFVALTAFLAHQDSEKPILLVDEAESHLHYDAQRDLVDVLIEQNAARQVVYTTHSPGCLPPDLGTSIRAVVPVHGRAGVSEIQNNFWSSNAPGFSPLLLMMGAGAAAFNSTRAAVLTEGPSEMILLPSLIRLATGLTSLPYHVAPGLSTTAPDRYGEFDFVATRLAYVVDGDAGGRAIKRSLTKYDFPENRILSLGGEESGLSLEDLVTPSSFLASLNPELELIGEPPLSRIPPGRGRYKLVEAALRDRGAAKVPSKVALAGRLIWQEEQLELSRDGRRALNHLHKTIKHLLLDV